MHRINPIERTSMRILMCSPHPLVRQLGAPKVLIELAEALRERGVTCDVIGPDGYGATGGQGGPARIERAEKLRAYLREKTSQYDVIDYDHEELPYPRCDFDPRPLMVARSVLLVDHLHHIPISWTRRMRGAVRRRARIRRAAKTLHEADLINVSNDHDHDTLVRQGQPAGKIIVLPFGLSAHRRALFEAACAESPPPTDLHRVAFVGTFDYRKGARDFPVLVGKVCAANPGARFRLLGTAGLFQSAEQVLNFFPHELWNRIEVVPRFDPDALPKLLADCSVGVFPSYYEGFGFGVLEMLAAAIPVVAYDAPGATMMLPRQWLVAPGDVGAMAEKVIQLMRPERLPLERVRAREIATPFDWSDIAQRTIEAWRSAIHRRERR